jgi:hypothetical protein
MSSNQGAGLCHGSGSSASDHGGLGSCLVSSRGICGGQSGTETGYSKSSLLFPSVSFLSGSPYPHIIWGMNRIIGGLSSKTKSHPIDTNMNNQDATMQLWEKNCYKYG